MSRTARAPCPKTWPSALIILAFLVATLPSPARAQPPPPRLTAPVNDFAHVIDPAGARELDRRIRALQQATGDAVVVATVEQSQPYADVDELAVKMFENAGQGLGSRGKDNGVLVLVAVKDRRVRIEVGYGIEGVITDGIAGQIIRESMTPRFKTGDYGGGLLAGVTEIINRIAKDRGVTLQDVPSQPTPVSGLPQLPIAPIVVFIIIALVLSRRSRRRRRYWGGGPWSGWNSGAGPFGGGFGGSFGGFGGGGFGGGGGGGFGGFGGGRSGGGGASGGW